MPPVRNPEGLTKEQLRKELQKHGVKLPSTNALKAEYISLYKNKILKIKSKISGFSSEEDEEPVVRITRSGRKDQQPERKPKEPPEVRVEVERIDYSVIQTMTSVGIIASELSDEQLRDELEARGVDVGPVVASTRRLYEKRLENILKNSGTGDARTVNGMQEYSDQDSAEEEEEEEEEVVVDEPTTIQTRHRRSLLRSSDKDASATRRRAMRSQRDEIVTQQREEEKTKNDAPTPSAGQAVTPEKLERRWIPVWVAILIVIAIVGFFYLVVQAMEANPPKLIPKM